MLKLLLMKLFNRKEYEWENEWTRDVFLGEGCPLMMRSSKKEDGN